MIPGGGGGSVGGGGGGEGRGRELGFAVVVGRDREGAKRSVPDGDRWISFYHYSVFHFSSQSFDISVYFFEFSFLFVFFNCKK